MEITEWYERLVGGASVNSVARRAGINQSTLNRQLNDGRIEPTLVVAIARAYGANVLDALVAQGLITREDVAARGVFAALADATDQEIAAAVWRRMSTPDESHPVFDEPISEPRPSLSVVRDKPDFYGMAAHEVDDLGG